MNSLPRPPKWRRVEFLPEITYFKPAGIPLNQLKEVVMKVEEVEAIRLRDLERLEQEECAEKMGISRATFFRIVNSARSKLTDAIVNGKAIRIEGGNFRISHSVKCESCGHIWQDTWDADTVKDVECPKCHGNRWCLYNEQRGRHRGRHGRDCL